MQTIRQARNFFSRRLFHYKLLPEIAAAMIKETPVETSTIESFTGRVVRPDFWWEDLVVGDALQGSGMTITDAHLIQWAGLTGDIVSLHLDEEYASGTQFGERIAHGPFTLSLALGLITQTGYFNNVVAFLGLDEMRALRPVLIGDTLRPTAELIGSRPSNKTDRGVWTFQYTMRNQRAEPVMTFRCDLMIRRNPEISG